MGKFLFLSTLSLRRATESIGTLRTVSVNFYPRSPCGERPIGKSDKNDSCKFLSTLSLRRATNGHETAPYIVRISIHALLAESDYHRILLQRNANYFYPRSPCGERQPATRRHDKDNIFLSTLSLRRATYGFLLMMAVFLFLSTLSLRRATAVMPAHISI